MKSVIQLSNPSIDILSALYQRLVSEAYYMVFLLLVMMGGAVLKLLDF